MRQIISLNENWVFTQNGQTAEVQLPHTWNAVDGQDGGNDYARGVCLYTRSLDKPVMEEGTRVYLEVCGAAMTAHVSLNGKHLASHQGGYSTFRVELTKHLNWPYLRITVTMTPSIPRKRILHFTEDCTGT